MLCFHNLSLQRQIHFKLQQAFTLGQSQHVSLHPSKEGGGPWGSLPLQGELTTLEQPSDTGTGAQGPSVTVGTTLGAHSTLKPSGNT